MTSAKWQPFWVSRIGFVFLVDYQVSAHMNVHHGSAAVYLHQLQWSNLLTHWGRVTHLCVSDLTIIGSDHGLSPSRSQSIIRTNANIVNRALGSKLQWHFNRNSNIFIHENAFESVVCEKASILSRPQCVTKIRANPQTAQQNPNCMQSSWDCSKHMICIVYQQYNAIIHSYEHRIPQLCLMKKHKFSRTVDIFYPLSVSWYWNSLLYNIRYIQSSLK